jgi:hypothetical protein
MGADRISVSTALAHFVCWWLWWILFMLFLVALLDVKLNMIIIAGLHDADMIDVVNAHFVWVSD